MKLGHEVYNKKMNNIRQKKSLFPVTCTYKSIGPNLTCDTFVEKKITTLQNTHIIFVNKPNLIKIPW